VVKDVTADFSEVEMHAALDVNIPNYAAAVVATAELIDALSSHADNGPAKLICSSTKCRHQSHKQMNATNQTSPPASSPAGRTSPLLPLRNGPAAQDRVYTAFGWQSSLTQHSSRSARIPAFSPSWSFAKKKPPVRPVAIR